jgi:hypothetical protein
MTYLLVCVVALVVSGLTFLSGFGLGTLLLPAFAVFFPVPVAVAASAAAFAGAFLGARLVPRLSLRAVQVIVGAMLFLVAGALGTGLVQLRRGLTPASEADKRAAGPWAAASRAGSAGP